MILDKRAKDLTGQRFGSLVAIEPHHVKNRMVYWTFQCDCGKIHIARGNTIVHESKQGDIELPSCGCVELKRKTKHGFRLANNTHPTYSVYRGMINRCYNPKTKLYKWYGAVGVTVCDNWLNNPKAFCEWAINNGWKKGLHIDKDIMCKKYNINPSIYSPKTCIWVSPATNVAFATNRNNFGRHPNIKLSNSQVAEIIDLYITGKETNMSELARMYNLKSPSSIRRILKNVRLRQE